MHAPQTVPSLFTALLPRLAALALGLAVHLARPALLLSEPATGLLGAALAVALIQRQWLWRLRGSWFFLQAGAALREVR